MIRRSVSLTVAAGLMVTALLLTGCQQKKKGGFTVEGTFKNADKLSMVAGPINYAYLLEVPSGKDQQPFVLDSVKLSGNNGHFSLTANTKNQAPLR